MSKESDLALSQNSTSDLTVYKRAFEFTFEDNVDLAIRQHRGEIIPNTVRRQMKYAAKHHRNELTETLLEVGDLIEGYFPGDRFMTDQRIEIFIDCLVEDYSDLYMEDIYPAFKKNLKDVRKYGELQVFDLLNCMATYRGQKNRLSYTERDNQHKANNLDHEINLTNPEVYKSYVEIIERFNARKENEAEELERKKAELDKAVDEAKRYHETFEKK